MKPGKYYIGDMCYVMNDEKWSKICDILDLREDGDGLFELDGIEFFIHTTFYGDGVYNTNMGDFIFVDSGTIGCCPVEMIDKEPNSGGLIIEVTSHFNPYYDEGMFSFGKIRIETS